MTQPTVDDATQRIYDSVAAYHDGDEDNGWTLLYLCKALAGIFGRSTEALRSDTIGSGARRLLDPDRAPVWALPWVAQFYGVSLPASYTVAQQRALIKTAPQMLRGTPAAITAVVEIVLTGADPTVVMTERVGGAYRFQVRTLPAETPDADLVAGAIRSQKPAGLLFEHVVSDVWTLAEIEGVYDTLAELEGDFTTLADMETYEP